MAVLSLVEAHLHLSYHCEAHSYTTGVRPTHIRVTSQLHYRCEAHSYKYEAHSHLSYHCEAHSQLHYRCEQAHFSLYV